MNKTKTDSGGQARLRNLLRVNLPYRSAGDEPERAGADTPAARLTAKYAGKGIRGRPWTRLKRLAQESVEEAMERIVELTQCDNDCVSLGASKFVLKVAGVKPAAAGKDKQRKQKGEKVKVKVRYFGKGKGDAERA